MLDLVGLDHNGTHTLPTYRVTKAACVNARALASHPKLVLADEPTSALDSKTAAKSRLLSAGVTSAADSDGDPRYPHCRHGRSNHQDEDGGSYRIVLNMQRTSAKPVIRNRFAWLPIQ